MNSVVKAMSKLCHTVWQYLLQQPTSSPCFWSNFLEVSGGGLPPIFAALSDRRYRPFQHRLDPFVRWSVQAVWKTSQWRKEGQVCRSKEEGGLPPTWFHLICLDYSLDGLPGRKASLDLSWCVWHTVCNLGLGGDPTAKSVCSPPGALAASPLFCDANIGGAIYRWCMWCTLGGDANIG